jgi:hypothetical protein
LRSLISNLPPQARFHAEAKLVGLGNPIMRPRRGPEDGDVHK